MPAFTRTATIEDARASGKELKQAQPLEAQVAGLRKTCHQGKAASTAGAVESGNKALEICAVKVVPKT